MKKSYELLNDPFLNKGTAFTRAEREKYHLTGILPPQVQTIEEQAAQAYGNFQNKKTLIEKRHYLMEIFGTNRTLFYYLFSKNLVEFMPIVYDPVISQAIKNYSEFYVTPQNAAYLSISEKENVAQVLKNAANGREIDLIVVTDAGAILGIGDWGTNGVGISIGKLMVYTAAAGINPSRVLPVVLDAGTDNQQLLDDPLYLGSRHNRVKGEKYYEFVDHFVQTAEKLFPNLYLHFEDFGRDNAANILHKYQDSYAVFNDDIEGTGIITLAGILGGLKISGQKLADQVYMCFGAGTAGAGIARRVYLEMLEQGIPEDEAKKKIYLVDKQGLLFEDTEGLTPEQKIFVHRRAEFPNADDLKTLKNAVAAVHPTILVGTSTQPNTFTQEIVEEMAAHTARPMIFPLSNPTELAEAKAENLIRWTKGKALVATGIPAAPVELDGVTYEIGQANNALIYPGLGLGVIAVKAARVTDQMISSAAHSLGSFLDTKKPGAAVLPPVARINDFSNVVAAAVANEAIRQKLNRVEVSNVEAKIQTTRWIPNYHD